MTSSIPSDDLGLANDKSSVRSDMKPTNVATQRNPLEEIGIEYHVATERFDRRICINYRERGRNAIPADAWEREQCNRNAMHETHRAYNKAEQLFSKQARSEMIKWIQRTAGHPEVERRLRND